jgi:hypothetical protein
LGVSRSLRPRRELREQFFFGFEKVSEKKSINIMVRAPRELGETLRELAFAARLPLAVYCLQILAGTTPKPAPPVPAELAPEMIALLKILHALQSNLSQMKSHAAARADLARLAEDSGFLESISASVGLLGILAKSGEMEVAEAVAWLEKLEPVGMAVNHFCRQMNESGRPAPPAAWAPVCQQLQAVFK